MPEQLGESLRILYATAETHPNHRADVATLFGKYLPRFGIGSDLLTLHHLQPSPAWSGGRDLTRPGPARGAKRHFLGVCNDLRMLWLARRGYDAVIVRDKVLGALIGLLAARLAGIPFVYWMSFPMVEAWAIFARERGLSVGLMRWLAAKFRSTLFRYVLYRIVLPRASHVFVQSEVMLRAVAAQARPDCGITAIPMGVDAEVMPEPSIVDAVRGGAVFAYLGTLNRPRHPEVMIEALALLRARDVDAHLLLIGDAEEDADRHWLHQRIAEHKVEMAVEITGWLPLAEGWRRCLGATAGLSPVPRGELLDAGSPTKLVEYLHLGLPVIANDQPDQALLLAAAGGVCTPMTPIALADAMQDILERPTVHQQISLAGQEVVRRTRSYDALAKLVAHHLREIALRSTHRE